LLMHGQRGDSWRPRGIFQGLLGNDLRDLQDMRREVGPTGIDVTLAERANDWTMPVADVFDVAIQPFDQQWHIRDRIDRQHLTTQMFPRFEQTSVIGYLTDTAVERKVGPDQLLEASRATACQMVHERDQCFQRAEVSGGDAAG